MGHKEPSGGGLMARKEAVKWRRPPLVVIACDRTDSHSGADSPDTEVSGAVRRSRGNERGAEAPPTAHLASARPPGQVSDAGCQFSSCTAGTAAGAMLPEWSQRFSISLARLSRSGEADVFWPGRMWPALLLQLPADEGRVQSLPTLLHTEVSRRLNVPSRKKRHRWAWSLIKATSQVEYECNNLWVWITHVLVTAAGGECMKHTHTWGRRSSISNSNLASWLASAAAPDVSAPVQGHTELQPTQASTT